MKCISVKYLFTVQYSKHYYLCILFRYGLTSYCQLNKLLTFDYVKIKYECRHKWTSL